MPYPEQPLNTFLNDLASRTPTPGGGSTSALVGALGVGLASMAALYTTENEKFKAVEAQAKSLDGSFAELRRQFVAGIEADIDAYRSYSDARKLPRTTPEEKAERSARIARATEGATVIPERIIADAQTGLRLVEELATLVNPSLGGDVAAAAYLLEAAARGAGIQVISNCTSDDKEGMNAARRARAESGIGACQSARERIDVAVKKMLRA